MVFPISRQVLHLLRSLFRLASIVGTQHINFELRVVESSTPKI